jgi:hypothetical protein
VSNDEYVNPEMRKLLFKFHLIVYKKHASFVIRKRIKLLNRQLVLENKTNYAANFRNAVNFIVA